MNSEIKISYTETEREKETEAQLKTEPKKATNNDKIEKKKQKENIDKIKSRTIIIGDVHGCLDELRELISKTGYEKDRDNLVFVGDLVGKGPNEVEVLDFAMEHNAKAVMGNWEYALIKKLQKKKKIGQDDNFKTKHLLWLEKLPYYLLLDEYNVVVVHAGLVPNKKLEHQDRHNMMYMRNLYKLTPKTPKTSKTLKIHNQSIEPSTSAVEHEPRHDIQYSVDHIDKANDHDNAWINAWKGPYYVVFGHDAKRGLQRTKFAIGIDTGCVYGDSLSAFVLPQKELVQVQAHKRYAPSTLSHLPLRCASPSLSSSNIVNSSSSSDSKSDNCMSSNRSRNRSISKSRSRSRSRSRTKKITKYICPKRDFIELFMQQLHKISKTNNLLSNFIDGLIAFIFFRQNNNRPHTKRLARCIFLLLFTFSYCISIRYLHGIEKDTTD